MALTLTKVAESETVIGNHRAVAFDIDFDSSYPANGEAISAADVGLSKILLMLVQPHNAAAARLLWNYDPTNGKILAHFPSGGATAAPTSLADPVLSNTLLASGAATASAVDATTPNLASAAVTPGRGKEVGATADLSSCKIRAYIIGI